MKTVWGKHSETISTYASLKNTRTYFSSRVAKPASEQRFISWSYLRSWLDPLSPIDQRANDTWPSPAKNSHQPLVPNCGTRSFIVISTNSRTSTAGAFQRSISRTTMVGMEERRFLTFSDGTFKGIEQLCVLFVVHWSYVTFTTRRTKLFCWILKQVCWHCSNCSLNLSTV